MEDDTPKWRREQRLGPALLERQEVDFDLEDEASGTAPSAFVAFTGRLDRKKDLNAAYRHQQSLKKHAETEPSFKAIFTISEMNFNEVEPELAFRLTKNVQVSRHNVFCNFIDSHLMDGRFTGQHIGDVNVKQFTLTLPGYSEKNTDELTEQMSRLTPDILLYDTVGRVIHVGDVSVSANVHFAIQRKTEKYKSLVKYFKSLNYAVNSINFVVSSSYSNLESVIRVFEDNYIMKESMTLQLYKMYASEAQTLMTTLREKCTNVQELDVLIEQDHKNSDEYKDDLTFSWNDNFYDDVIIKPYVPFKSEEETIQVVKDEVDRMVADGSFFETDAKKTKQAFENLINKNSQYTEFDPPKSTLKVVDNCNMYEELNDHNLLIDYIQDISYGPADDIRNYMLAVLPTVAQANAMKYISDRKMTTKDVKSSSLPKTRNVYGKHQYIRQKNIMNTQIHEYDAHISKSKKNPNTKKAPKHLNPVNYPEYIRGANTSIEYYGSPSCKPKFLDESWDSATDEERAQTEHSRKCYEYCSSTNGAQHANAMSFVYNRMTHLSTFLSKKDNIIIPPNGSFIAVVGHNHCPTSRQSCELPFLFLTRTKLDQPLTHIEYEFSYQSGKYIYYVSSLCRFNTEKAETWNNAGYKLVATSSYLLAKCPSLWASRAKLCGILFHMLIDTHQKLSEFLDLLKYVSFMPFATLHKLPSLVEDKFDIMLKTRMDVWILHQMRDFIMELSKIDILDIKKPDVKQMNLNVTRESLGTEMSLPSFIDVKVQHTEITQFIEEISMLFTIRPKQLYGSQYMDKSTTQTAIWNLQFEEEMIKYGGWVKDGYDEKIPYPHAKSDFCFDSDVIYWSNKVAMEKQGVSKSKVESKLAKSGYNDPMHSACGLKGCTKTPEERARNEGMHTTTLNACLKEYREDKYDSVLAKAASFAKKFFNSGNPMEFSMSAKQQRGSGRPIATGTLFTKAALRQTEIPEACRGMLFNNNIIVSNVNKLSVQCETYKAVLAAVNHAGFPKIVQMTEDQSKYSEMDNDGKYKIYVRCETGVPIEMKKVQMKTIQALPNRIHYFKHLPKAIENNPDLSKYLNKEKNGIKVIIGWPQGMLNNMSTSIHANMDIWITDAFNRAYPESRVYAKGLVHSDDSWMAIGCSKEKIDLVRFAIFRMVAKRMACLKLNTKKLWISPFMGEMVSHFNINGNVHLSVAKVLANSFTNLTFQNWPVDVHNQVSSIQQAYRHGATMGDITMMSTILRQQMIATYHVTGMQKTYLYDLPIDIGGYPDSSPYELGVTGVSAHYKSVLSKIEQNKEGPVAIIVNTLLHLSLLKHEKRKSEVNEILIRNPKFVQDYGQGRDLDNKILDEFADYESVKIPCKGEVFSAVNHVMPRVRKMAETLKSIRDLPFEPNDMEMILTKPLDFDQSLMNLKAQTKSMMYELSTSSYTNDTKRMAAAQAMQSSGRVVKICHSPAMTLNEMYVFALALDPPDRNTISIELMRSAFSDDTDLTDICSAVVRGSSISFLNEDKRKIITRMPNIGNRFKTIGNLKDVLVFLIDDFLGTNYKSQRPLASVSDDTLKNDSLIIQKRFVHLFEYYDCKKACSLVMQQFMLLEKERTWVQPHMRCENLQTFLEELYGKTLHHIKNYAVDVSYTGYRPRTFDRDAVQTLYCTDVLNEMYEGKVKMNSFNNMTIPEAISSLNYAEFDDNDMLKYGLLMYKHNGIMDGLNAYSDKCTYQDWWTEKQSIDQNGRYYGPFVATVRFHSLTIRIKGSERMIDCIIMSKMDPVNAMRAMQMFVEKNFPGDRYRLATAWGHSPFWNQNESFNSVSYANQEPTLTGAISKVYLNYYSSVNTRLEPEKAPTSVQVIINHNLTSVEPPSHVRPQSYSIEDNLRQVYRVDENKHKIGSVKHNFSLPLKNLVTLEPALISSMQNTTLYSKGVLADLVTQRYHNITKDVIIRCLSSSNMMSNNILYNFFINYTEWITDKKYNEVSDETRDVVLSGVYEVVERSPYRVAEDNAQIDTFDLADVNATDYEIETKRVGSLYKVKNVRFVLASILSGNPSENRTMDFIAKLCHNEEMIKALKAYRLDKESIKSDIMASINACPFAPTIEEIELYAFLYVNNLHTKGLWESISIEKLKKIDLSNKVFKSCPTMIDLTLTLFINTILELERKPKKVDYIMNLLEGISEDTGDPMSDIDSMEECD